MKQAPFISLTAGHLDVGEGSVKKVVRNLRDEKLFTTGPNGRGAPDMVGLDAVRVFIALVASNSPSRAVRDVQYFGALKPDLREAHPDDTEALGIDAETTLEQTLLSIVENRCPPNLLWGELNLRDDGFAAISCNSKQPIYQEFYAKDRAARRSAGFASRLSVIKREGTAPLGCLHEIGFELIGWEVD